jgi:phage FluMu protein Com
MEKLKVSMDFACCLCGHSVSVTVQCEGKSLTELSPGVATVNVPCPTCHKVNQLKFEPSGAVLDVTPYQSYYHRLEPSLN